MIKLRTSGSFKNTENFFEGAETKLPHRVKQIFHKYGQLGVEALREYTPKDTGETADSWSYEIENWKIIWTNTKILTNGTPLAILIQYGHGTRGNGYVQGVDYINPALKEIFDMISDGCWKEVQDL
jgi:hypothetical protein